MTEIKQNYTIKNCPAFNKYTRQCRGAYDRKIKFQYCSGNSEENCPLKQIVELCKNTCRKRCTNDCLGTRKHCGYGQILNLLEIEVINE